MAGSQSYAPGSSVAVGAANDTSSAPQTHKVGDNKRPGVDQGAPTAATAGKPKRQRIDDRSPLE